MRRFKADAFELVCHHANTDNQEANPVFRFILFLFARFFFQK